MVRKNKKKTTGSSVQAQKAPVASGYTSVQRPMRISAPKSGDGRVTITHTEWVCKVTSSGTQFAVATNLEINPGLSLAFPWLSTIANNYETYAFNSMRFRYVPRCPTSTAGTVMMLMDYDCLDSAPVSEQIMMNSHRATGGPAWAAQEVICDSQDLRKWPQRYTRKGVHVVPDQKTYDLGRFFVAVQDVPAGGIGSIVVDYSVTLMTPQLRDHVLEDTVLISQAADEDLTGAKPLGDPDKQQILGGLPIKIKDNKVITVKYPGDYYLNTTWNGLNITQIPDFIVDPLQGLVSNYSKLINAAGTVARFGVKLRSLVPDTDFTLNANVLSDGLSQVGIRATPGAYTI